MPRRIRPLAERLWARVDRRGPADCWPFLGSLNRPGGYGQLNRGRRGEGMIFAHRAAYEVTHGPIPAGLVAMHSCDSPSCCNPAHITPGTQAENVADMRAKARGFEPPLRRGQANGRAKLTAEQVLRARLEVVPGSPSRGFAPTARALGVAAPTLVRAVRGTSWRHVEEGREALP